MEEAGSNQEHTRGAEPSRRDYVGDADGRSVKFASRMLSQERLEALRLFLAHASADEVAYVRGLYGDNPEVLRAIGLELTSG